MLRGKKRIHVIGYSLMFFLFKGDRTSILYSFSQFYSPLWDPCLVSYVKSLGGWLIYLFMSSYQYLQGCRALKITSPWGGLMAPQNWAFPFATPSILVVWMRNRDDCWRLLTVLNVSKHCWFYRHLRRSCSYKLFSFLPFQSMFLFILIETFNVSTSYEMYSQSFSEYSYFF